ncbi:MAG TPA: G1 family glutamic endopeptidase [Chloroflexota bacterium]|jgi:hypothetical protein|nr:G1 family glutamic endopeptidase [Chloroflexota bacterium]
MSTMLPNNLAAFPKRKPSLDAASASRQRLGRAAARLALLIVVGGLFGLSAYRWAIGTEEGLSPSPVSPQAEATAAEVSAPDLIVTGLLGNHPTSQNWSGYAATEGGYTGIRATWTIPDLGGSSSVGLDAVWVGIGGVRTRDLIQAGTQRTVLQNGATQTEAWVELLPRASETVPFSVDPGDTISVSIDQDGPETWVIVFTNITRGQTYEVTRHYASSLSSAEWVVEAASAGRRGLLPLDQFGTVQFSQASALQESQVLNISESGAHAITMITPGGVSLAVPSAIGADGDSFSVTRTSTPSPSRRR